MTRAGKTFTILLALLVVVAAGWLCMIGAAFALGGVITVELVDRSEGLDLYLPVPVVLVDAVLMSASSPALSSAGFPTLEVDGVGVDLGELGPFVLELFEELDQLPDVTLVEVEDGFDRVRISKTDGKLRVEVEEPGTSIEIAVPTRGARRLAARLLR